MYWIMKGTSVLTATPCLTVRRAALLLIMMMLTATTAVAQTDYSAWGTADGADGSEAHPYVITTTEGLDLLATEVNNGAFFDLGTYFVLGADITYSHTTDWNDDSSTENNFTPIGEFGRIFDGQGHTISGIRIYSNDYLQGLFRIINGGTVRNVILADARITGHEAVGGIAGYNACTIENCYVGADVVIGSIDVRYSWHGGIVGKNAEGGTVNACTSCATLMETKHSGGVVGENPSGCTVSNCRAAGVTIYGDDCVGAIVGSGDGTLSHNYYSQCTRIENENSQSTEGIGTGNGGDVSDDDGAVRTEGVPLLNGASNDYLIADYSVRTDEWGYPEWNNFTLAGRTLYKDGSWNTLCLPFELWEPDINAMLDTPASIMELASSTFADGVLILNFEEIDRYDVGLQPGKPYIVRWNRADDYVDDNDHNLWQPTTADNAEPSTATSPSETDWVDFIGSASPVTLKAGDRTVLYVGTDDMLYYPEADMQIGSCRGYFKLKNGLTAGDPSASVRGFILNFGDGDTGAPGSEGIHDLPIPDLPADTDVWHSLDGRRLSGKPNVPGVYVRSAPGRLQGKNHGCKVVMK